MGAELRPDALVPFVCLADLGNTPDGHLRGQAEPLAKLTIDDLLEVDLVGAALLEGNTRRPVGGLVEPLDRGFEPCGVVAFGQQLGLECQLHTFITDKRNQLGNSGVRDSSHP